ncbi:glycosyltransferase family 4 protein [Paenibacillus sp. YIM B09110]|uniref:glycosyltransferase family 4 protein n=1 Tax=Paenibacillus sp. YIM B09110 TaxID=3126102 RepID=UPI00301B9A8D
MSNKKAAYVATVYAHISSFHLPFIRDLQEQGYEVHVYASPDHCLEDVKKTGVECRDIPFSRNPLAGSNIAALKELTKRFREEKYHLVHVHTPNASVICRIAAWRAKLKNIVYTAHGFHFFKGASIANWLIYFPVEWMMSSLTDTLITINKEDYERAKRFPVRGSAIYMPGVGIDLSRYRSLEPVSVSELKSELGIRDDSYVILCIAELNRNKNQEQLIRSIGELKKMGVPVVGVIAGTGTMESHYQSLARELGLEGDIRFLGFRRDVPELMNIADVVTLMSRREGLPKVLLEAMGVGKPMVVTSVRGNRDLVVSGHNGYVVPVDDVPETVRAFYKLYDDREARDEMGRNSYKDASHYDLNAIRQLMTEAYARLT